MINSIEDWYLHANEACNQCIASGEAFVSVIPIDLPSPIGRSLTFAEEQQRQKFRLSKDQQAYTLARLLVRKLLLTDSNPTSFSTTEFGKPFLPGRPSFNISHSGNLLALIVCDNNLVGIDIESSAREWSVESLFGSVCHPNERVFLEALNPGKTKLEFLKCWTRKEAFLKALGTGLNNKLTSIDVQLSEEKPELLHPEHVILWPIATKYADAVCTAALPPHIKNLRVLTF